MSYKRHKLTDEDREKLEGSEVVASVSGGKDSAALSLWLTEQGVEHHRVFADTQWEHPATPEYVRGVLTEKLGPIHEVGDPLGMEGLVKKKGMFPSRLRRWCTEKLKVNPIKEFLKDFDDPVNAVGIRAAESKARATMTRWEEWPAADCEVWRPLIEWTVEDVIEIHTEHGLRPNPLYLMGAERVGCWPCIFSRKSEVKMIADTDPERIAYIRELEKEATEISQARRAEKGKEPLGWPKTFFSIVPGREPGIDGQVKWSRTDRGGKQFPMFPGHDEPPGCMRWGLCDALPPEGEEQTSAEEDDAAE